MGKKQRCKKSAKTQMRNKAKAANAAAGKNQATVPDTAACKEFDEVLKIVDDYNASPEEALGKSPTACRPSGPVEDAKQETQMLTMPSNFVAVPNQSRGEKKMRRIIAKFNLKPIGNVSRVVMVKSNNVMLYIDNPDVYKSPYTDTYICLGQVQVEDLNTKAATQAAERYINRAETKIADLGANHGAGGQDDDDGDPVDANGADEHDIELVRMQANCSRKTAIEALSKNDNDVVNAIMELTLV